MIKASAGRSDVRLRYTDGNIAAIGRRAASEYLLAWLGRRRKVWRRPLRRCGLPTRRAIPIRLSSCLFCIPGFAK
jgi:hypothetical protein